MIIDPNPFLRILPKLRRPALDKDTIDEKRDHDILNSLALTLIKLLFGGEFHDETIDSTGTIIPHQLHRRPMWRVILRQDANQVLYDDYENWNDQKVVMLVSAGTMRVVFWLFCALVCVLPGAARAAECATYGYAQKQPVRFWLCALAADTTTGAADGDYRYNKDTDVLQTYNGAVWANVGGGGGGAPTTATYLTQTPDAGLSAEQAMSLLPTGITMNTTGTGVQSIYPGSACGAGTKATSISASGVVTCSAVSLTADVSGTLPLANGGGLTAAADDTIPVGDGSAWVAKTLPNTFSNGTVLGYRTATNNFNAEPVYQSVQEEAVALTSRGTLNFIGAGVTCVDNAGSVRTDCTVTDTTTASALLDTLGSARGSILYRGATGWTVLTSPAYPAALSSTGSGADPAWSSLSRVLPIRIGLPRPPCNAVRRANWQRTNCS